MTTFDFARCPPQWLRAVLAAVLLGFALNSIAHVTHQHDAAATSATHSVACGYCVSFGALADAPRRTHELPRQSAAIVRAALPTPAVRSFQLLTSAQPRAPPIS